MGCERVAEAFDVTAGERSGGAAGRAHQGRVADEDLVRPFAVAQPDLIGLLRIPGDRCGRAIDLVLERVLSPSADLADADRPAGAVLEAKQYGRGILGGDAAGNGVGRAIGRES